MARAHRVYLACPSFRRHRRRRSSRPIASNTSNRISTTAVAAMPVAMYIVGLLLLRSIVLVRHRGRRDRCAHVDRVQSAPVGCPSRVSGPPVKLVTTQRSDYRLPTLDSQLRLSRIILSYHFFKFCFCLTYINLPPLADGSILHPWTPLVLIHTLFLAQNYYSASMHTRILQTRSRAFFFSIVITVATVNKSNTYSQSVSFIFLHPVIVFLLSSVLTAIRQRKPYTVTFFTVQYGVLQLFFYSIHHFVPPFLHLRKAEWG
jgi:hypothetical protein